MKKHKNTIIFSIIGVALVVTYFIFRKKAWDKGFSNSKFYATLFGVPYQDINAEVVSINDFTVEEGNQIAQEFEDIISGGAW
jgi:uncharacterized membrane protein